MKIHGIRRRSGSYIVEAALIYPAIVLISTMLILLMLFLFSSIQDLSQTGGSVRRAAAEASETVWYGTGRENQPAGRISGAVCCQRTQRFKSRVDIS